MDWGNYYLSTLITAAGKLGPLVLYLVLGWLIFIKLPFLFLLKNMRANKHKLEQDFSRPTGDENDYKLEDYQEFQRRMRLINKSKEEKKEEKKETKQEKTQEKQQERKQGRKQEQKKDPPKAAPSTEIDPFELFNYVKGQKFTKEELRKRYHELLRQNHPDRVAQMGPDFKKLADKKTKDINSAYEKLKNRAA
jgi:DnaJ-domain-containing protein 1